VSLLPGFIESFLLCSQLAIASSASCISDSMKYLIWRIASSATGFFRACHLLSSFLPTAYCQLSFPCRLPIANYLLPSWLTWQNRDGVSKGQWVPLVLVKQRAAWGSKVQNAKNFLHYFIKNSCKLYNIDNIEDFLDITKISARDFLIKIFFYSIIFFDYFSYRRF
jgi:hypothetical protein